jgi:hypothetical protein
MHNKIRLNAASRWYTLEVEGGESKFVERSQPVAMKLDWAQTDVGRSQQVVRFFGVARSLLRRTFGVKGEIWGSKPEGNFRIISLRGSQGSKVKEKSLANLRKKSLGPNGKSRRLLMNLCEILVRRKIWGESPTNLREFLSRPERTAKISSCNCFYNPRWRCPT